MRFQILRCSNILFIATLFISSCENVASKKQELQNGNTTKTSDASAVENETDKKYDLSYFSGKAELNTYTLEKARYNGIHSGESVLIFVTEPFLKDVQVKADNPTQEKTVSVLKMNRIDRFVTGIYDYSIYTSVFTSTEEVEPTYPLKITMSSQDWCGQSFMQLNNAAGFDIMLRSYFESEGDTSVHLHYEIAEDNIFNLVRIDTSLLPTGEFDIIPTKSYLRLSHEPLKTYTANASLANLENQIVYSYDIPELRRGVRLFIDPNDHFQIVRWEETYPTVFDGKLRKSTYTLKQSERLPYWKLNQVKDAHFRDSLNLK